MELFIINMPSRRMLRIPTTSPFLARLLSIITVIFLHSVPTFFWGCSNITKTRYLVVSHSSNNWYTQKYLNGWFIITHTSPFLSRLYRREIDISSSPEAVSLASIFNIFSKSLFAASKDLVTKANTFFPINRFYVV